MTFTEYWYGDVMERIYTTNTDFREWDSWVSIDTISDSSSAWKTLALPDLDNSFKVAMVRSARRDDLVPKSSDILLMSYHILIYRPAMGVRFEDNPTVCTRITVKYKGEAEKDEQDHITWYEAVSTAATHPRVRVENTSSQVGYQEHLFIVETSKRKAFREESNIILELKISITMDSDRWDSRKDDERTRHFRLLLSRSLNERFYGNVEFYHSKNPSGLKLYAFSHIWEYPAFQSCVLNSRVPGEGEPEIPTESSPSEGRPKGDSCPLPFPTRRSIPITHDFDLFQHVLRYLYTNSICFLTSSDTSDDPDVPAIRDCEGVYKIAASLKIEPLRKRALHFISASCTVNNISQRTFSPFAREYLEVGHVYDAYFLKGFTAVIETDEFAQVYNGDVDANQIKAKFLQLVRRHETCKQ